MDKKQQEMQRHQEDAALNRGLIWVAGAIVLEVLLLLVNQYYFHFNTSPQSVAIAQALNSGMKFLRFAGIIAAVGTLVWLYTDVKKEGRIRVLPVAVAAGCAALGVCSQVIVRFQGSGMRMLFVLVAGWAALALIFYLYQTEMFLAAVAGGLGIVGMWFARNGYTPLNFYSGATLIAIVLVAVIAFLLAKGEGSVQVAGHKLEILPQDAKYVLIYATCAINFAAVGIAIAAGVVVAYYLTYALLAWLFALLVYYTVKMM